MSQERSRASLIAESLFVAALAWGGGLLAMAFVQAQFIRTLELRLVLILSEMALAMPALVAAAFLGRRLPEIHRFSPMSLPVVLKTAVLGLALWALSLGMFEAQYVFVRPPLVYLEQFQGLHALLKPGSPLGWVFSIGAIAVAPALCEEILFRGLLTPVLRFAAGPAAAIVSSAALFGAIHIDALPDGTSVYYRVPFAFFLGMLLAKIRLDTGSLWPSVIAHATLNATTFVIVFLMDEPKAVLPDPQPVVALGMLLVGGTVARILMRQIRPMRAEA